MGSCQSQQQKQSQIARTNITRIDLQKVESNQKNNLHVIGDDDNQEFIQTEDELHQEINNVLHYQDQFDLNNNITFEIKSLFQES